MHAASREHNGSLVVEFQEAGPKPGSQSQVLPARNVPWPQSTSQSTPPYRALSHTHTPPPPHEPCPPQSASSTQIGYHTSTSVAPQLKVPPQISLSVPR